MAHAQSKQSRTSLLDLPPELRSRIFEHCVLHMECSWCDVQMIAYDAHDHDKECCLWREQEDEAEVETIRPSPIEAHSMDKDVRGVAGGTRMPPPITRVNRQIRAESLPMWYGLNAFCLDSTMSLCWGEAVQRSKLFLTARSRDWLEAIGSAARAMLLRIEVETVYVSKRLYADPSTHDRKCVALFNILQQMGLRLDKLKFEDRDGDFDYAQRMNASKESFLEKQKHLENGK